MEIYNHSRLNGQEGPGNLAVLHRLGYAGQSQSHFDSQQYWQNGVPGDAELEEGLFYRHLAETRGLTREENKLVAAAISSSQLTALRGADPVPDFTRASDFDVLGSTSRAHMFLGQAPSGRYGAEGDGLLGLYGDVPDSVSRPCRTLVHKTGELLGGTINTLQEALQTGPYTPENRRASRRLVRSEAAGGGAALQADTGADCGFGGGRVGYAFRPGSGQR